MNRFLGAFSILLLAAFVFSGCAKQMPKCDGIEDNPAHHYRMGMELLDRKKLDEAASKFERASYCDDTYGPAHAGLAIVEAMRAAVKKDNAYKKVDSERATEHLKAAYKNASRPEDEFAYHLASMRVYTILKASKNWLGEVEDDYKDAMKLKVDEKKLVYYDGGEAASYFMGAAYLEAREFQRARDMFGNVIGAKAESKWASRAEKGWKKTDKIVRALAGTTLGDAGKEIALKDSVGRADMAALLIDELKVDKLFAGRIPLAMNDKKKAEFVPADMLGNQFREEAETLMKWNVRGLEPIYDETTKAYLFKPEDPVTRKELAFVIEDVLLKITGDEGLATAYFGHEKSPFPDVAPSAAWYNAVMNVTTRNIMEGDLSGEFRPNDAVDGAEAVLAVRVLRQHLNVH
ncbi:MAG: S-layer homology domain-containing protein [Deltaproteobacteria bacterium]|nr:S-layer homology domain-containing protein [Deltaproteobacteria bacterium]